MISESYLKRAHYWLAESDERSLWPRSRPNSIHNVFCPWVDEDLEELFAALGVVHQRSVCEAKPSDITVSSNYGMMPVGTSHQRGRAAALKALEIDDTLAEAHAALGTITSDYYWDWAEADRRFRRAIELNPSYATAYHRYSFHLGKMGRFEEALGAARRAQELEPLSLAASANVGVSYFLAHRNEEAMMHLRQTLDIDPKFGYAHLCLGLVHMRNGMVEAAIREFQAAKALTGLPNVDALIAYAWAQSGDRIRAEAILGSLDDGAETPRATPYPVALVQTALGDRDRAFLSLERAIDARESFVGMLKVDRFQAH